MRDKKNRLESEADVQQWEDREQHRLREARTSLILLLRVYTHSLQSALQSGAEPTANYNSHTDLMQSIHLQSH